MMININDIFSVNMEDDSYYDLLDNICSSKLNQKEIISYIKKNILTKEQKEKIFFLLSELYELPLENLHNLDFIELYEWLLNEMFDKKNYDYSNGYRFVHLLKHIKGNDKCVYNDVVNRINIDDPMSVRIAITSTYKNDFYKYPDVMDLFFEKIIQSLKNKHKEKEIRNDFNNFLKEYLVMKNYKKYKTYFR
ncbi:MAG: hypothetical protein ACLUVC_13275 [Longibaculum sp.]